MILSRNIQQPVFPMFCRRFPLSCPVGCALIVIAIPHPINCDNGTRGYDLWYSLVSPARFGATTNMSPDLVDVSNNVRIPNLTQRQYEDLVKSIIMARKETENVRGLVLERFQ